MQKGLLRKCKKQEGSRMVNKKLLHFTIADDFSMSPLFEGAVKITIKAVSLKEVRLGDIIVYKKGVLIAHRCLKIIRNKDELSALTKGDYCKGMDNFAVKDNEVIGKVIGFTKNNRGLSFERPLWRIINILLWGISYWQFYYAAIAYKAKKSLAKFPGGFLLKAPFTFLLIAGEKIRQWTVKLLVRLSLAASPDI